MTAASGRHRIDLAVRVGQNDLLHRLLLDPVAVYADGVEERGDFVELAVVLSEEETQEAGMVTANALMRDLGIREDALIDGAYVDLLETRTHGVTAMH